MLKTIPLSPLAELPLEEVLLMMSMKEDDPGGARTAFREFHRRFKVSLWKYCKRSCVKLEFNYSNPALTVFDNVLNKAYLKAGNLLKIEEGTTEDDKNRIMSAWLKKTAYNEINDLYAEIAGYAEKHELTGDDKALNNLMASWLRQQAAKYVASPEMELIRNALDQLSERDRHIYLSLLELEDDHRYIEKDKMKWLADFHNTTKDNIYHIRQRADKKIREYIDKHTKPKDHGSIRYIPGREKD